MRQRGLLKLLVFGALSLGVPNPEAKAGFTVFAASGPSPASIQSTVDSYRTALGTLNANTPGSFSSGRREINWDGVPDAQSDPNLFPSNFFNANVAGRARGVEFATPGTGFLVSADSSNPTSTPLAFGFPTDFVPFSPQRLFAPVGSNITDISFFVPGSSTPATVTGFGAVFSDVETANISSLEAFDSTGMSLFSQSVPTSGNAGLSFLGILANAGELISRIRLTTGESTLIANGDFPGNEAVVLDDFIYAEPQVLAAVPEPTGLVLLVSGALGLLGYRQCRRANRLNPQ